MYPTAYKLYIKQKTIFIDIGYHMPPTVQIKRKETFLKKVSEMDITISWLKLVEIPQLERTTYRSAIDIINDHVVHLEEDEDVLHGQDEEITNCKGIPKHLIAKVKNNARKRMKRDKLVVKEKILWDKKRLKEMIRTLNIIFMTEGKKCVKDPTLVAKLAARYARKKEEIKNDLENLEKISQGWLTKLKVQADYYWKIDKSKDINVVVEFINTSK